MLRSHCVDFISKTIEKIHELRQTRSSAITERPCDAPCRWKFYLVTQHHLKLHR